MIRYPSNPVFVWTVGSSYSNSLTSGTPHPVGGFAFGLGDRRQRGVIGFLGRLAQRPLAAFVAEVSPAQVKADAAGEFPQAAQGFRVTGAVVTLAAVRGPDDHRVVGEQNRLPGPLMPQGQILADGLGLGEVLKAQHVHKRLGGFDDLVGDRTPGLVASPRIRWCLSYRRMASCVMR